jgi:uncharacterized BrkB/YihY/UPF0761 family membrane protein
VSEVFVRDEATRTRKGWDIALSVFLLLLAATLGVVGSILAFVSIAFIDNCPPESCSVDGAVSAQFTAALLVILAFVAGLIATIVALATRRRGWWVALLTAVVVLVIWVLGFVGYFTAVGWQ